MIYLVGAALAFAAGYCMARAIESYNIVNETNDGCIDDLDESETSD